MRLHGHLLVLVSILLLSTPAQAGGVTCSSAGMFNPITDVCWDCIFPIRVGSVPIVQGRYPDEQTEGSPIGFCPAPPPIFQRVGVNISYWEPYSLVDVVKEPYCLESMGMSVGSSNPLKMGGTDTFKGGGKPDRKGGFYDGAPSMALI